jgi:hypothetical protein
MSRDLVPGYPSFIVIALKFFIGDGAGAPQHAPTSADGFENFS